MLVAFLQSATPIAATTADKGSEEEPVPEKVTIKSWEFCEGCKSTVNLFSKIFAKELGKMQRGGVPSFSSFEAASVVNLICDDEYFNQFVPAVRYSCINIMDNHREQFLRHFTGNASAVTVANKALVFSRKREICINDVAACSEAHFKSRKKNASATHVLNKKIKEKSKKEVKKEVKCSACLSVGSDINMIYRLLKDKNSKNIKERLEEDFCDSLGYNHSPYSWLESVCDEIVEEKINDVLDVFSFHNKVSRTGLTPSQTFPEMMCAEFYQCSNKEEEEDEDEDLTSGVGIAVGAVGTGGHEL